jgi:hypothetical protein
METVGLLRGKIGPITGPSQGNTENAEKHPYFKWDFFNP